MAAEAFKAGARITEHALRNGLQVLVVERPDAPTVTTLLYYRVGARNERVQEAGVSHFLEHMMFKGTERYGKGHVDLVTTCLGGSNNAWTSYDHTAYWFEFAADRWEQALELEANRMRGLLLEGEEYEAEKAVVLEEMSMTEDDPWRELSKEVGEAMFNGHPYGRPVIGYQDTLEAMGVDDMRAYFERYYRPDNAILVICGNVTPSGAMKLVRKHFGSIKAPETPAGDLGFRRAPVEPGSEKRLICRWDDGAKRLCLGWPTVQVGTDEDYALDLITVIMATGRGSRLYQRLIKTGGLATSVSMSNDTRIDGGALWLMSECAGETTPEELEHAIDEELDLLSTKLVTAKELKRARAMLHAAAAHDAETVTDLAEDIGSYAADANWRLALDSDARLAAIKPAFLRETARKLLPRGRRVTGWSLPEQELAQAVGK